MRQWTYLRIYTYSMKLRIVYEKFPNDIIYNRQTKMWCTCISVFPQRMYIIIILFMISAFYFSGSKIVRKYPVLVFIHGESYEWNSGNPYDGRVLASNAELVVVTLNYRLGILGKENKNSIILNCIILPHVKCNLFIYVIFLSSSFSTLCVLISANIIEWS